MDAIFIGGADITPEESHKLYVQFIINEHLDSGENELNKIDQIASGLNNVHSQNDSLDQQLNENISHIKEAKSLVEIPHIVDRVVSAIESIKHLNQQFTSDMKSSADEITFLKRQLQRAERKASVDQLTKLSNRYSFDTQLAQLTQHATQASSVCLILIDLDHFKSLNDDYGHVIGDTVLRMMGELIRNASPDSAICARYGGEEFAIILTNSSIEQAAAVADKLHGKLQQVKVELKKTGKILNSISASFGVARFKIGESVETFIDRTDQALYRAKDNGRNRVEIF